MIIPLTQATHGLCEADRERLWRIPLPWKFPCTNCGCAFHPSVGLLLFNMVEVVTPEELETLTARDLSYADVCHLCSTGETFEGEFDVDIAGDPFSVRRN